MVGRCRPARAQPHVRRLCPRRPAASPSLGPAAPRLLRRVRRESSAPSPGPFSSPAPSATSCTEAPGSCRPGRDGQHPRPRGDPTARRAPGRRPGRCVHRRLDPGVVEHNVERPARRPRRHSDRRTEPGPRTLRQRPRTRRCVRSGPSADRTPSKRPSSPTSRTPCPAIPRTLGSIVSCGNCEERPTPSLITGPRGRVPSHTRPTARRSGIRRSATSCSTATCSSSPARTCAWSPHGGDRKQRRGQTGPSSRHRWPWHRHRAPLSSSGRRPPQRPA